MTRQDLKQEHRTAKTSIEALKQKKKNGSDISDRERCKAIIEKYGPITAEEMEIHMGKTQSKFAGRIRKLKDLDEIEVTGKKPNSDGRQVQVLDIKEETEKEGYLLKDKKTGKVIC